MGLALKDIPISDYVFVQYPAGASAVDPDRLDPNPEAAAALFAALEANEPLALAGEGDDADAAPETPAQTPTPTASATPQDESVTLPGDVTGTTGDTEGCAAGRVY